MAKSSTGLALVGALDVIADFEVRTLTTLKARSESTGKVPDNILYQAILMQTLYRK